MSMEPTPDVSPERATGPAGEGSAPWQRHDQRDAHSSGHGGFSVASPVLATRDATAHTAADLPDELADTDVSSGFGTLLEPVLRRACRGRLGEVRWFRADWQRGGALTGYATFEDDDGSAHRVVVKLPVPPCERHWLVQLQDAGVVPRVFAHGEALNGYDLAWVVMERLNHGPLGPSWGGAEFDLLIDAVGRFYAAAQQVPRVGRDAARWKVALKKAARKVAQWAQQWNDRPCDDWCHGDLHLGNAMTRQPPPSGPALLFDFAKTRVGHWLSDAVYFEHLFWSRPDRLDGRRLCSLIAQERKRQGLPVDADWARLADVKRALLAIGAPLSASQHRDPQHLQGALAVLERAV
jgi:hypothetical protein